jgi:DNA polymerase-3 subunit alpha/error-prone DNA polymerase
MRAALLSAEGDGAAMAELERDFLAASTKAGVRRDQAAAVWKLLARFVAYSFNKAHAASYARLAWQTAYLKTHHIAAFACAVLNTYGGHYPLRTVAADFARHGVRLLAPHVNHSEARCGVESGAVRVGLSSVKGLTVKSRERLLEQRPFQDFRDLLARAPLGFREVESLVLCGACDGLAPLVPEGYPTVHEELLAGLKQDCSNQQLEGLAVRQPNGAWAEVYSTLVRIRNELNVLNMHLCDHPMRVLRREALRQGCVTTAELAAWKGKVTRIAGLVAATRRLATSGGQIMQFVTFEDEAGLVEAVLFAETYAALGDPVMNPGPFLVGGRVAEDRGEVHLIVSEVTPFHARQRPYETA